MKPCKFTFDDERTFDGFALGSTWNGFDNVAVTEAVLQQVRDWMEEGGCDADDVDALLSIHADENGLFSLANGYATQIVEEQ